MVASNSALGAGWCEGTTPLTEGRLSDADPKRGGDPCVRPLRREPAGDEADSDQHFAVTAANVTDPDAFDDAGGGDGGEQSHSRADADEHGALPAYKAGGRLRCPAPRAMRRTPISRRRCDTV